MQQDISKEKETGRLRSAFFLRGLRDGVPIATGYLAVAFTLGITAANIDMTAVQSFMMSLGMVASAGEYAAIILIGSAAGVTVLSELN